MIIRALKNLVKKHKTIPAPEFLEDDPWFGPATLSEKQIEMKEARKQLEEENLEAFVAEVERLAMRQMNRRAAIVVRFVFHFLAHSNCVPRGRSPHCLGTPVTPVPSGPYSCEAFSFISVCILSPGLATKLAAR